MLVNQSIFVYYGMTKCRLLLFKWQFKVFLSRF